MDKALALCQHKNLGDKFQETVLSTVARQGKYNELKTILDQYYPSLQLGEGIIPSLLVTAYLSAVKGGLPVDDVFDQLFAYASQVDPKLKFGDLKLRDSLLFDLGSSAVLLRNKGRAVQSSKEIKSGFLKKELNEYIKQEKLI